MRNNVVMASVPVTPLTEEQYLAIEESAPFKSEFHNGRMFAMAGGSPNHSLLASNAAWEIRGQIPSSCRVFNSDLKIKILAHGLYTYADCTVVCGEPELAGEAVLNPILLVEVLSPSTQGYDRGEKFAMYRTIASLREYVIVHQDRRYVEHHSKQADGTWLLRDCAGPESAIVIPHLNVRFPLDALYAGALPPL